MASRSYHRSTLSRTTPVHPRAASGTTTTSNNIHPPIFQQLPSTYPPLTPQVLQAHNLHHVSLHQDPSYLSNIQQNQLHLLSTSLNTLGTHFQSDVRTRVLHDTLTSTPGMETMERFEATSPYPLRNRRLVDTPNPQTYIHNPPTTTSHHHHSQTSSTQVQLPSTDSVYYPGQYNENYSPEIEYHSSPTHPTTYTPPNTNPTHWGHPLSGAGTQFPNEAQAEDACARTRNGYNNSQRY